MPAPLFKYLNDHVTVATSLIVLCLCYALNPMGLFSKKWDPRGKHCYVTGGSSGLGLETAIVLTKKGAHVSIVARNLATLEKALATLETHRVSPDQRLAYYSFALNTVEASAAALDAACKPFGGRVPDAAFLVVGGSYPRFFVEMTEQDLLQGMEMGYWVQAFSALELVKRIVKQNFKGGKIVFVGSTLSYMSFVGWASYAPAKHALRGLADTLRNELLLYSTDVHMFFAPTMNTPGYETEMKTKPAITAKIEGEDGHSADKVAIALTEGVFNGDVHIAYDFVTNLFRAGTRGVTPQQNNFLWETILGLIAWIGIPIWRLFLDSDTRGHRAEHQAYLKDKGLVNA